MLRIICCYVPGQLRPETERALYASAEDAILGRGVATLTTCELSADDDRAYGVRLAAEWKAAYLAYHALAIVEPDIVVRPDVIDVFLDDPAGYVCFPYNWLTDCGPALGCTRFSAAFIERYPQLMDEAVGTGVSWRQLDVTIMRRLLARKYGEQPKVCLPPVVHLSESKGTLLPDANPEPMLTVPHW